MSQPHVLIVEDSTLVAGALRVLFEETGHRVSVAATVGEATARCESDIPDVMLLDLALADGNGLEVLDRLRGDRAEVPVTLAFTGRDDPDTARRCLDAGCREVLVKPVPTRELLAKVRGVVAERESRTELGDSPAR